MALSDATRRAGTSVRVAALALCSAFAGVVAQPIPAAADASAATPSYPAPEAVIARVVARNPSLQTFQADVHVDLHMTSFPWLSPKLEGHTYFKRPNNYEVDFTKMPSYAQGFSKFYSDIGDPSSWPRRFAITVVGSHDYAGHQDLELRMVQRVRGMIDHETVLVDPTAWAIDEIDYHYYNGGAISMTQQFEDIGNYSMLASQHVTVEIPHVHAVGTATYTGYRTNVALNDAVFKKTP